MRGNRERRSASRRQVRRAFTLVEILAVVAIIGVLLTVIMIASVRALAGAREQQTRTTIKKIDEILSSRMAAFERAMTGRILAGGGSTPSELLTKYDYIPDSPMKNKRLKQKFFGTSFGEMSAGPAGGNWTMSDLGLLDASGVPVPGSELAELAGLTPPPKPATFFPAEHQPLTENPEMLYWIITNGPTFGSDVQTDFNSSEIADTDGDGLMEFIDAWGRPLRFYRWPTRLIRPGPWTAPTAQGSPYQPLGPAAGGQLNSDAPATFLIASLPSYSTAGDTIDPTLLPSTPLGQDSEDAYGDVFINYVRETGLSADPIAAAQQFEREYHTLNTWHAPLVVSAGADGELGLYEPTDRANFGHLAQPMPNTSSPPNGYSTALQDNVTNLNGQASGTGGQ
ncbi:MAG: type II secretion system protein [Planctomycetaceae bacterium]